MVSLELRGEGPQEACTSSAGGEKYPVVLGGGISIYGWILPSMSSRKIWRTKTAGFLLQWSLDLLGWPFPSFMDQGGLCLAFLGLSWACPPPPPPLHPPHSPLLESSNVCRKSFRPLPPADPPRCGSDARSRRIGRRLAGRCLGAQRARWGLGATRGERNELNN